MTAIREELMNAAINRAYALIDYNIQNNVDKKDEFLQQIILADESLTNDEKSKAIRSLYGNYDQNKIRFNKGKKRICETVNWNVWLHCIVNIVFEII